MIRFRHLLLVAGLTLATSVQSQPVIDYDTMPDPVQSVEIDLDGDGAPEIASAYTLNDRYSVVTIRPPERGGDYDFDTAFITPINLSDFDTLEVLQNGNLRVHWGCFACGRYHSSRSVIVDARAGVLQVIGYDDSYADRIFAAVITCSVNLLTGAAIVEAIDVERRNLTTDERSFALSELRDASLPLVCRSAYERYDDDFMAKNYPEG